MSNVYTSIDQLIGHTPLLELTHFEADEGLKARVLVKLEYFNPAGSVKDRVAKNMIDEAEKAGKLVRGGDYTIIEPTSGNTGIGLAAIAAALFFGSRTEKGKAVLARFAKHFRFFSSMAQQQAGCRFADVMNLALRSGLTPERGLELVAMLNQDPDFQVKLETCQKQVNEGEDLSHALFSSGILTGTYARLASIGQKTGSMDQVMKQVSDMYQEEIDTRISNTLAVLEPSLIIGLSLIVGIILLSVMLPLMGIMSGI